LSGSGRAERISGEIVTGTYFPTLGVQARLGRLFGPDDDRAAGDHAIAVVSHAYWQAHFAGDPAIVGKGIVINNTPVTIVGVAQEGFDGTNLGNAAQIFVPITLAPLQPAPDVLTARRFRWLTAFGRLRPGVTADEAQQRLQPFYSSQLQMETSAPYFARASAETKAQFLKGTIDITPAGVGKSTFRRRLQRPLWILMTIVACVLLISCANVANLLIARASARQREVALRLALGATRMRIVRQLLIESLVLAMMGGIAGLVIAVWGSSALLGLFRTVDTVLTVSATPDLRILGFTLAVSLFTGLLFGIMPAWRTTSPALAPTLKNEAASVVGGGQGSLRTMLIVSQMALSLLLLIGAGLFTRSLTNLLAMNPGIDTSRLLTFNLAPGLAGYQDFRASQFRATLLERIRATPGVESVGIGGYPLLTGGSWNNAITVEGLTPATGSTPSAMQNGISPGFFSALGMHIVAGRDFDQRDLQDHLLDKDKKLVVGVVNQAFAKRYLPDGAIGRHVGIGGDPGTPTPIEIIGIVSDAKYTSLREETQPQLFQPYLNGIFMTVYIRTTQEPAAMAESMRRIMAEVEPSLAIYGMETFNAKVERSLIAERMVGGLSSVFGVLATLLAMIGLYGVMAYSVSRRTREIGVRMAMGAQTRQVAWLILRQAVTLVACGVAIGLPAAWFASRYIEAQLYGVQAMDPVVVAAAVVGLTIVAAAAGLVPAWRATRVNPVIALRYD
jgi:predicted permease